MSQSHSATYNTVKVQFCYGKEEKGQRIAFTARHMEAAEEHQRLRVNLGCILRLAEFLGVDPKYCNSSEHGKVFVVWMSYGLDLKSTKKGGSVSEMYYNKDNIEGIHFSKDLSEAARLGVDFVVRFLTEAEWQEDYYWLQRRTNEHDLSKGHSDTRSRLIGYQSGSEDEA